MTPDQISTISLCALSFAAGAWLMYEVGFGPMHRSKAGLVDLVMHYFNLWMEEKHKNSDNL